MKINDWIFFGMVFNGVGTGIMLGDLSINVNWKIGFSIMLFGIVLLIIGDFLLTKLNLNKKWA